MFYVLAAYYARGRFLSAVRQSAPSGTSRRGFETPGLRLLVTGSIHYTIKIASAVSRRRRKSKIVHAQRPDQIPPRAFYASNAPFAPKRPTTGRGSVATAGDARALPRHPRAGGNPEKNKARHLPLSRRREPRAKQSTPPIPHTHPPLSRSEGGPSDRYKRSDRGGCAPVIPAQAGTQRKTKHAD